ncbi:MAG: OmpA family protein [Prevotellaceae bacterium]|jgi:outer membrane protein OmpA-like peptidoglycan-associated protein|nr:OmpA family protein [Prevotellaceae bacterium]
MKRVKLGIAALALFCAGALTAQTTSNPWLIGIGAHAENHEAVKAGFGKSLSNFKGAFTFKDYEISPPWTKLTVARNLNKLLVLDWQTSIGNVSNNRIGMDDKFFLMTGLGLQFKIAGLWNENSWFDPYIRLGASYLRHDYSGVAFPLTDNQGQYLEAYSGKDASPVNHFMVPGGIGANFWFTENLGLNLQGDYVPSPMDDSDVSNFWQASASLLIRFGSKDTDGDGIVDRKDRCPDVAGPKENGGCPWEDTDGDGVLDKDDNCPDVAGPVENGGCPWPDTDGDGVNDQYDKCPDVAGPKENDGCPWPDTDGDGVLDKDDRCPNVAGPKENKGCPWPDSDGDGVLDKDDKCPNQFGLKEYNGCPKPKAVEVTETFKEKNLLFDLGKTTIRPSSSVALDEAARIMKSAPSEKFLVVGHTDKKGSDASNLKLSQGRAASVVAALEKRGVSPTQLKSIGVGESEAEVPETATDAERQQDRKVVVKSLTDEEWEQYSKSDVKKTTKK